MSYTTDELKQAETFILEAWAKKIDACNNENCQAGIGIDWEKGITYCPACEKQLPASEVTRAMIKELIEGRDNFKFWHSLCDLLNIPMRMHEMRDGESLQIVFLTTNELTIAFHRAYGGKES